MNMKSRTAATLTVKAPGAMTEQGRREIRTLEEDIKNPCFGSEIHNRAVARLTALIDGATGLVIEETRMAQRGFGETRRLLEVSPFRHTPWLTPELCEQELAMQSRKPGR